MSSELPIFAPLANVNDAASKPSRKSRVEIIMAVILVVIAVVGLSLRLIYPFDFIGDPSRGWLMDHLLPPLQREVGRWSLTMMLVYPFGVLAILMGERWFPAVPTQKTISTGAVHDALWIVLQAVVSVMLVSWYSRLIEGVYARHLSFLTLPVAKHLPALAALAIAAVVLDLTRWGQHWLHHNVKWLWPFHAVHHAQRELNLFSDYRIHFMEYVVRRPVSILPMLMLGLEAPDVTWWLLLLAWHARFYHANIKSNLGPLRYILVTPQSHRVHHSREPEHVNCNYGAMLSVWDYVFGTQYRKYDVYPNTGITDENFPHESAQSVSGVLATVGRQMLYPFRQIWTVRR